MDKHGDIPNSPLKGATSCSEPGKVASEFAGPVCERTASPGAASCGSLWALPGGPPGLRVPPASSPWARAVCHESS